MTMRSPIIAMLWENWRLTRVEAAQRLGIGIVGGSGALLLFDNGPTIALWILVIQHGLIFMSIAKLNGGRFMDGYKPGFPLYLLYTRPVRTISFVGIAMAYDALAGVTMYLASAALLGVAFGQPLPLFSMALLILVYRLAYLCIQWSTRSRVVQWIGSIAITLPAYFLVLDYSASPAQFQLSLAGHALLVLIGVVSVVLTVVGVARQRRGDAVAILPRPAGSSGYPDWLVNLFRFPCPSASATRAQVWFELKSSGLPVLAIGLGLAMLIALLFAIAIAVEFARPMAVSAVMLSAPTLLFLIGGNAFGIRRRQGRTYASAFEVTQPYGTAQLVGLKVLVRTSCALIALIVVGVSVWASSSLLGAWGSWVVEGKDAVPGFLKLRREIGDSFAALTGYSLAAQAIITLVGIAFMVASFAAFAAVRARYPRRLLLVGSLLLFHGLVLVLLALAEQKGIAPALLVETIFAATGWALVAAMVLATFYLFWRGFVEHALTINYASATILISAAFGAAWLTMLHAAGMQLAGMSAAGVVGIVWPVLLPLLASVLAPWSLNRIRHT